MKARIILAGLTALAVTAVGSTAASARPATDTSSKTISRDCIDALTGERQGAFTWEGPTASWPPSHKIKSAVVTLTDEDDEALTDDVSLEVAGIHDEARPEPGRRQAEAQEGKARPPLVPRPDTRFVESPAFAPGSRVFRAGI